MKLEKFSVGCGDRFGMEAEAQLEAFRNINDDGIYVVPVWNKSYREHQTIGTNPDSVKAAVEKAVKNTGWKLPWHVDADHINFNTAELFIKSSDFFTLDVAGSIGAPADAAFVNDFIRKHNNLIDKEIHINGLGKPLFIDLEYARRITEKYLPAAQEAGKIYRLIREKKKDFIAEVSMDETSTPQQPAELLLILAMIASEGIPAQTIAPKFSGRFNKGVEYAGNINDFEREFEADVLIIDYAVKEFGLPENLKLSIHSGSDKFSIYPVINRIIKKHNAGLHLKTAGTTWLEEIIGLAEAGGSGLVLAKDIYREAYKRKDELCAPYSDVIDIKEDRLPAPDIVDSWDSVAFVKTLRHNSTEKLYNADFRQLIHVGYKIAAEKGPEYINALSEHRKFIAENTAFNLYERHMKPLFL